MDEPFKYLGRDHRVLFHDRAAAYTIARNLYPDDDDAVLAAWYHIVYDEICSQDPQYREFLEFMASLDKKKRTRRRRSGKTKKKKAGARAKKKDTILRFKIVICDET